MADNYIAGILPFNTDDPAVLLRSTLTSAASITSPLVGSGGTVVGSANTFDPDLGMKLPFSGSGGATWANLTGYQTLDAAGQISFEVEAAGACANSTVYGSMGDEPNRDYGGQGLAWLIVWTSDGGTTYGRISKSNGDANVLTVATKNAGETNGAVALHTQNKAQFVRITLSWCGGTVALFVDGKPVTFSTAPTRNVAWSNQFATIWMGHFNGGNGTRLRYMRNLIIANKPVMMPRSQTKRIAFYGHSFAANYGEGASSSAYDETTGQILLGRGAARRGMPTLTVDGAGGGYVISALTTSPFQLQNTTYLNSLKERRATDIVFFMGTNDVGNASFTSGAFDTDIKALLTTVNSGHDGSFTQRLWVGTVPTRNAETGTWNPATMPAKIIAANAIIAALPAWWNGAVPSRAGQLQVLDFFTLWGGMTPGLAVQTGQLPGASANLHPSPLGALIFANEIERAVGL